MSVAAAGVSLASPDLSIFRDQQDFCSAVSPAGFESFENVPDRDFSSEAVDTPSFVLTSDTGTTGIRSTPTGGHYASDGEKYVVCEQRSSIRFTFDDPIKSFGVIITDWGDADPGSLAIRTNNGPLSGGHIIAANPPILVNSVEVFFGFHQTAEFTEVVITSTATNDGFGMDEVRFSNQPVAERLIFQATFTGPKQGVIAVLSRLGQGYRLLRTTDLSVQGAEVETKAGTGGILLFQFDDSSAPDQAAFFYIERT